MHSAKSVCHGCAKGCNIFIDHNQEKYKSDTIFRYRPRINKEVNGHFICDEGRLSYKEENSNRLEQAYAHNKLISKENAIAYLLHALNTLHPLLIVSPSLSLEELTVIQLLSKHFKLEVHAYVQGYEDESFEDEWLRSKDRSANLASIKKLDIKTSEKSLKAALECTGLIINFNHFSFLNPSPHEQAMLLHKKEIHFSSHNFENCRHKKLLYPIASFSEHEGSLINEGGILQKYEAGLCNERENILSLVHELIATPSTAQGVWDAHLKEVFGFEYEAIGDEGRKI